MAKAPFPVDQQRTAIAVAYRNKSFIADGVLPRVPVSTEEFKYMEYPIEESFALPDTHVGRKGKPNEIELSATEQTASTDDYGLEDAIPQKDIDNAPKGYDPIDRSTEQLADYILLDREVRTANMVQNAANYPAGNKVQLAGTDQFSDYVNSDPLGVITAGLDSCLVRPNIMTLGRSIATTLAMHPQIVKAIHGNSGDAGIVTRQALANLFELEEVLVGESYLNTAKKGQAASLARVWGNHISLIHRNKMADTRNGLTFGLTAQWGSRVAGSRPDPDIGLRGGTRVRVGESVKELIIAGQAGYFIQDAQ
jgi:hypothetical protein